MLKTRRIHLYSTMILVLVGSFEFSMLSLHSIKIWKEFREVYYFQVCNIFYNLSKENEKFPSMRHLNHKINQNGWVDKFWTFLNFSNWSILLQKDSSWLKVMSRQGDFTVYWPNDIWPKYAFSDFCFCVLNFCFLFLNVFTCI